MPACCGVSESVEKGVCNQGFPGIPKQSSSCASPIHRGRSRG